MSFGLGERKAGDAYFDREGAERRDAFPSDVASHEDLFETISEAHYLPELGGPHDEALLDSLVEKGCEDNQILGQALDKLAHLVHAAEYPAGEEGLLLGDAPVADIIERLEQSLEPANSSMTAAQGLLHLHRLADAPRAPPPPPLAPPPPPPPPEHSYISDEVFEPPPCDLAALAQQAQEELDRSRRSHTDENHMDYDAETEKRLQENVGAVNHMYTDSVPDSRENCDSNMYEVKSFQDSFNVPHSQSQLRPDQSEVSRPKPVHEASHELGDIPLPDSPSEREGVPTTVAAPPPAPTPVSTSAPPPVPVSEAEPVPVPPLPVSVLGEISASNDIHAEICVNGDDNRPDEEEVIQLKTETDSDQESVIKVETVDFKELEEQEEEEDDTVEMVATDLSLKQTPQRKKSIAENEVETTNTIPETTVEKSDELPKDLSFHKRLPTPHASPRRTDVPRAPSRESDAMQSPQPSGIPAVPSSPELFTMPLTKSKQTLFLETLLSSPSPKMYTSEVTITKQQCEPLNLGKHRKSASPTVTSCSDEIRKLNKEFGEPQEKKSKSGSMENLAKISKIFNPKCDDISSEHKHKKPEKTAQKLSDEATPSPLKQLHILKTSPNFNIPDPLLIPKDKMNDIVAAPGREIPALLIQRPELRLPQAFAFPAILQDPNIAVISLAQLENIIIKESENGSLESPKPKESKSAPAKITSERTSTSTPQGEQSGQPKSIPSMDALAGDIDAATSAALNQMFWLPYISQLEAMAACSQNMDFLKALNSSGYNGPTNYPELSQMFNSQSRFMGPGGFPMMPPDYDNRLQFAMWQEAMNHANTRNKPSLESQMKELASKSSDVQNPYVHSTKSHQSKSHTSARTSPIAHSYNSNHSHNQRMGHNHNPFLQGMYPGMNPNIRPNVPLPGLQIPYFNPNMMSQSQRSPRTVPQKSPTSPYYPNNNYLQSVKTSEPQRSSSTSSQESPRPRISVKSLKNLLEPPATATSSRGRVPAPLGRRRDTDGATPEVGSTTPLGEAPPLMPPHPHDPSSFHLWHPLFGNQKSYASPWSWTTVTATGD